MNVYTQQQQQFLIYPHKKINKKNPQILNLLTEKENAISRSKLSWKWREKESVLDLRQVFEGLDMGFGVADIGVSFGECSVDVLRDPFGFIGEFLPFAQ